MSSLIPQAKVVQRLGHTLSKEPLSDSLKRIIEKETDLAEKIISPKKIIRSGKIRSNDGATVKIGDDLTIQSTHIAKLLRGCHTAYGFAVTIGKALIEKRDFYTRNNESINALILDSIGSVAVEEYVQAVNSEIGALAGKNGNSLTRRFSPGYGDWKLDAQVYFLPWVEAEKINIRLNENQIMIPEKSISAIVGAKKAIKNS